MDLSSHVEAFTRYGSSYLTGDDVNDYHIQLKIDHSLRVLGNARTIIDGESIGGPAAQLGLLAALYHDIGRFPQYNKYGTYKDADSINHGRMGVLTLRELDLPKGVSKAEWHTIRTAVALHNVKSLNPNTPTDIATITNIVRDADKIDIYPIVLEHFAADTEAGRIVIHNLENEPARYSEEVLETVLAEKTCDYGLMRYANDFILVTTGWILSLNFSTSIRLFAESGLVEHAFSMMPKDYKIQALEDKVFNFMHYNSSLVP